MAAECCSICEYQRTVGYPSNSWASCSKSHAIKQKWMFFSEHSVLIAYMPTVICRPNLLFILAHFSSRLYIYSEWFCARSINSLSSGSPRQSLHWSSKHLGHKAFKCGNWHFDRSGVWRTIRVVDGEICERWESGTWQRVVSKNVVVTI